MKLWSNPGAVLQGLKDRIDPKKQAQVTCFKDKYQGILLLHITTHLL